MPSGSKFLLILVGLTLVGGIGFYSLLPHYLKTNRSAEQQPPQAGLAGASALQL